MVKGKMGVYTKFKFFLRYFIQTTDSSYRYKYGAECVGGKYNQVCLIIQV